VNGFADVKPRINTKGLKSYKGGTRCPQRVAEVSCGLLLPDYICAFGDASSSGEADPPRTV
jgi:hypothetical protein